MKKHLKISANRMTMVDLIKILLIFILVVGIFYITLPKPYKPIIIDYWISWDSDAELNDLKNSPDFVDVVNLAFLLPKGDGSVYFQGGVNLPRMKEVIKMLQQRKKKVLISLGGADALNWNLDKVDLKQFAKNIKRFVDEFELDGVDIDYEVVQGRDKLPFLIKELREELPSPRYLLTYTPMAIGAYGTPKHSHNEWSNSEWRGVDVEVLTEIQDVIDWVNVMAYNAFDPNIKPYYDPRSALFAFRDLLGGRVDKVVLGIHPGKQDWPKDTIIESKAVEEWLNFVKNQKFKGIMVWSLSRDVESQTGEPSGTFNSMLEKFKSGENL